MSRWKKFLMIALAVITAALTAAAESEGILRFPQQIDAIEAEAFVGLSAAEEVIIPEGTSSIGARAFAEGSVRRVHLPASLTAIAADAFDGCSDLTLYVHKDTFAHAWCEDHDVAFELADTAGEDCVCTVCGAADHDMEVISGDCFSCVRCGLAEHVRPETRTAVQTGVYRDVTDVTHVLADVEIRSESCGACGLMISESEVRLSEQLYVHTYPDGDAENGSACPCGYVCRHENAEEWLSSQHWDEDSEMTFDEASHTIQVTSYYITRCRSCGAEVGSRSCEEAMTEEHYFYEGNVCDTCGYERPACSHAGLYLNRYTIFNAEEYSDLTETTHTAVGSVTGSLYCRGCDYWEEITLEEGAVVTAEHSFSDDGTCWECGYAGSGGAHAHAFGEGSCVCTGCGETVHDESFWMDVHAVCDRCGEINHEWEVKRRFTSVTSCDPLDGAFHVLSGEAVRTKSCMACGLIGEITVFESCKEKEAHSFADGVCTGCGRAVCGHESVTDCVCADCGETVHSGNGVCTECGEHLHERGRAEDILEMRSAVYSPFDEQKHTAVGDLWAVTYCTGCGGIVPGSEKLAAGEIRRLENHRFTRIDGMIVCADCGWDWVYVPEGCLHANTKTVRRSSLNEITQCTPTGETGVGDIIEVTSCADCGAWIDTTVVEENVPIQQPHLINGSGGCFNCDYLPDCVHASISWTEKNCKDGVCVPDGADGHILKGLFREEGRCLDCGATYYDGDYDGEGWYHYREVPQPHNMQGCLCADCGYAVHQVGEGCVCTACGEAVHTPGEDCACTVCGAKCHDLNLLCVCRVCGEAFHEEDGDCLCSACGTMVHALDENCLCTICGALEHAPDENCLCANCGFFIHDAGTGCVCRVCGEPAHALFDRCVCEVCGAEAHLLDKDCVCGFCGFSFHELVKIGDEWDYCTVCTRCDYADHYECGTNFRIRDAVSCVSAGADGHYSTGTPEMYTYCYLCREVLSTFVTGGTRTLLEAHSFDENQRCTVCGYQCDTHAHSFEDGSCVCTGCGETVHRYYSDGCDESDCGHFAHSACVCGRCGHDSGHNYVRRLRTDRREYTDLDDFRHLCTAYMYTESSCSRCGKAEEGADRVWLDPTAEIQLHNYEDDAAECWNCGHPRPEECAHEATYTQYRSSIDPESPTLAVTDTHRTGIGKITQSIYCSDCGQQISYEVYSRDVVVTVGHRYGLDGRCSDCGYTPDCAHANLSEDVVEFEAWAACPADAQNHTVMGMGYFGMICDDCGVPFSPDGLTGRYAEQTRPHSFTDGVCHACGYAEGACAAHPDAYDVVYSYEGGIGNLPGDYELVSVDETHHSGTKERLIYTYCPDCDRFVRERVEHEEVTERHHFELDNGALWCRMCDARFAAAANFPSPIECDHTGERATVYTQYLVGGEYTDITEITHTRTDAELWEGNTEYCLDCMSALDGGDGDIASGITHTEPHQFWEEEDGSMVCECGYLLTPSACGHAETFSYVTLWDRWGTVSSDEAGHTVCYEVMNTTECADCGRILASAPGSSRMWEPHGYDLNGVCTDCEFSLAEACSHPEAHYQTSEAYTGYYTRKTSVNSTRHIVYDMKLTVTRCGDCGVLISASAEPEQTLEEHTVENGFCTGCGCYVRCSHENLGEASVTEEKEYRRATQQEHGVYTVSTEIAACADCRLDVVLSRTEGRRMEAHDFTDGVCACGTHAQPEG